jgi:zinc protease
MSKPASKKISSTIPKGYTYVRSYGEVEEYVLSANGLRVLYQRRPDTGTVTTNITYRVGARDEARGETGLAHMLEHMLFKPTTFDVAAGITAGSAMQFERESGCVLNANTWKDRTTYFFNYPVEYFERAVQIEAERMTGTILTPEVLAPEQGNVLSEFDMYNGDPHFGLTVDMVSAAYFSHPYGHETIGYREDIERYTADKLERFYRTYYNPQNAVMMVIGDIPRTQALEVIAAQFGSIVSPSVPPSRNYPAEPRQTGLRRVQLTRPTSINLVSIGFKHEGFPTVAWLTTRALLECLAGGPTSVLQQKFVDTGRCASISWSQEPTADQNLGMITLTLAPGESHAQVESDVRAAIMKLTSQDLKQRLKHVIAQLMTAEYYSQDSSLGIAAELTEYVAADALTEYGNTIQRLQAITTKQLLALRDSLFDETQLTIGHVIGTH